MEVWTTNVMLTTSFELFSCQWKSSYARVSELFLDRIMLLTTVAHAWHRHFCPRAGTTTMGVIAEEENGNDFNQQEVEAQYISVSLAWLPEVCD
jgi:hypothetical protein